MRYFLFMLSFCLLHISVLAKERPDNAHETALRYYSTVNKAELAIVRKDIPAAMALYKEAFAINFEKAFSRDLFNAFHCAMECKKYESARKYLTKVLSRGLSQSFIDKNILTFYTGSDLDSLKEMLAKTQNDTIRNTPLNRALDSLMSVDQGVRRYFSQLNDGNYMTDSVKHVDQRNAQYLWQLLKQYGVPNANLLGNDHNMPLYGAYINIIILHHAAAHRDGAPFNTFDTLLYKAIFTFDFPPTAFMQIMNTSLQGYRDQCFSYQKYRLCYPLSINLLMNMDDNDRIYTSDVKPGYEPDMDAYRQSIGLESIEDLKTKILFSYSSRTKASTWARYQLGNSVEGITDSDNEGLKEWMRVNPNAQTPD